MIESVLDKRAGVLATILVQEGTLHVSDYVVSGEAWAKIRAMTDSAGERVKEAGRRCPCRFWASPSSRWRALRLSRHPTKRPPRRLSASAARRARTDERERIGKKGVTLADLFGKPKVATVNLIVRADTQGSLEAIKGVIAREGEATEDVDLHIMLDAVGAPTEADLLLAGTADATVIAFGVNPAGSVKKAAERQGIPLKTYRIIYDLIEDVQRLVRGQIEPEFEERTLGHAEIRQVIAVPRAGTIAGSYVTDGLMRRGAKARLTRGGKEVYKGSIAGLRRFKDDVREVQNGFECGINLQNYENVQEGDIIEAYEMVEVPARV